MLSLRNWCLSTWNNKIKFMDSGTKMINPPVSKLQKINRIWKFHFILQNTFLKHFVYHGPLHNKIVMRIFNLQCETLILELIAGHEILQFQFGARVCDILDQRLCQFYKELQKFFSQIRKLSDTNLIIHRFTLFINYASWSLKNLLQLFNI